VNQRLAGNKHTLTYVVLAAHAVIVCVAVVDGETGERLIRKEGRKDKDAWGGGRVPNIELYYLRPRPVPRSGCRAVAAPTPAVRRPAPPVIRRAAVRTAVVANVVAAVRILPACLPGWLAVCVCVCWEFGGGKWKLRPLTAAGR
jgi:hypothetical protein